MTPSPSSLSSSSIDRRQQAKAIATALGVLLVTTHIQPIWRVASAILGRLYLNAVVVATAISNKKRNNEGDEEEVKVSGLYIHPGTNRI